MLAGADKHLRQFAAYRRVDGALHFHGFHHQQPIALGYLLVQLDVNRRRHTGYRRADLSRRGFGINGQSYCGCCARRFRFS